MRTPSARKSPFPVLVVLVVACSPSGESLKLDAAVQAYRAAEVERFPPEITDASPRFYGPVWWDSKDSIPGELGVRLGLDPAPADFRGDPPVSTLLVNFFEPRVYARDSIEVMVELLVFEPGGGFHGPDFVYLVDCSSRCTVRELIGRGYLN